MKIIEDVLRNHFILSFIVGESSVSEHLQELIALPIRLGGMTVTTPHLDTEAGYNASKLLTNYIVDEVISQDTKYKPNKKRNSEIKSSIKKKRKRPTKAEKTNPSINRENMSKDQIRANDVLQQPHSNNWLNLKT